MKYNSIREKVNIAKGFVGYEYEARAKGKCTRRNGASTGACYSCSGYESSMDAKTNIARITEGSEINARRY